MNINEEDTILDGTDVSHWQNDIDWTVLLKNKTINFVLAKATEGATYQDPRFQSNWQAMKQQGVPITGAYHYFRGTSLPSDQANNIVTQLKQAGFNHTHDLFAISVGKQDKLDPSEVADYLREIIGNLTSPIIQEKVIIYTSPRWWNSHVQDIGHRLSQQPLWVAHWTTAEQPQLPEGWNDWMIWHYSSKSSVSGIQGEANLDRMKIKFNTTVIQKASTVVADDAKSDKLMTDANTATAALTDTSVASSSNQNISLLNCLKSLQSSLKSFVDTIILFQPIDHQVEEILKDGRQLMNKSENLIQSLAGSESFINQNFYNFTSAHNPVTPNILLPVNQSLSTLTNIH